MIGERLAEVRKDHNDRQADLAQKLHVTLYTVRSWEQEKSAPSHEMLVRICRLYQVSSDYLLFMKNKLTFTRFWIISRRGFKRSNGIKRRVFREDHLTELPCKPVRNHANEQIEISTVF